MQACHITREDLASTLCLQCKIDQLERVEKAHLERNGAISFSLRTKLTSGQ